MNDSRRYPLNPADPHLAKTRLLDFDATSIAKLIEERGWADLPSDDRIGAIYDFVRNEITFGYNRADDIPASEVLADGHGQCNTKGTLLMALLRGVGVRCRLHGFTIHKALQRGVVPELVYPLAPSEILHSWVEVDLGDGWVNHRQNFGFVRDLLYRHVIRHWMNARVRRIRRGILPPVPGFDRPNHRHEETNRAA